jgi:hypothetical protein
MPCPTTIEVSDGTHVVKQEFILRVKDAFDYTVSPGQLIQSFINAAPEGSKIAIESGTYTENLNINKCVFLVGSGQTHLIPAADSPVITISASGLSSATPVYLRNLDIRTSDSPPASDSGKMTCIWIASPAPLSFIELDGIVVTGNNHSYKGPPLGGLESGVNISPDTSVSDLVIANSSFANLSYGFISGAITAKNPGYLRNVEVRNTAFNNNSVKGIYVERLSDAVFDTVTAGNNGNTALSPDWADTTNSGIDINLEYGSYQNITLTNVKAAGNGIGSSSGAGLSVKARGSGNDPAYASVPATLSHVVIDGGTFTGNNVSDLRFGETGKANSSPTDISVKNARYGTLANTLNSVSITEDGNNQ